MGHRVPLGMYTNDPSVNTAPFSAPAGGGGGGGGGGGRLVGSGIYPTHPPRQDGGLFSHRMKPEMGESGMDTDRL